MRSASARRSIALAGAELRRVALMRGVGERGRGAAAGRRAGPPLRPGARARAARHPARARRPALPARRCSSRARCRRSKAGPARFRLRLRRPARAAPRAELEAALVVAAHGSWEPLPSERALRREQRRPSDLFAFKANFRDARSTPDLLPVLSFAGGYGGMVVADDGIATLAGCIREDRLGRDREASPGERAGDVFEAILRRECAGVAAALARRERDGPWLATGPIRPGVRLGQGDGVFRIGNAAGEAHPIVGEGISMAMQSAFVLAAVLGPARPRLVDSRLAADGAGDAAARVRGALAAALRPPPARRRGLRPPRDAAVAGRGGLAAGARLARPADARRALERQDPLCPEAAQLVAPRRRQRDRPLAAFGG